VRCNTSHIGIAIEYEPGYMWHGLHMKSVDQTVAF